MQENRGVHCGQLLHVGSRFLARTSLSSSLVPCRFHRSDWTITPFWQPIKAHSRASIKGKVSYGVLVSREREEHVVNIGSLFALPSVPRFSGRPTFPFQLALTTYNRMPWLHSVDPHLCCCSSYGQRSQGRAYGPRRTSFQTLLLKEGGDSSAGCSGTLISPQATLGRITANKLYQTSGPPNAASGYRILQYRLAPETALLTKKTLVDPSTHGLMLIWALTSCQSRQGQG
ncbi:hypothetical protein LX32DRAFT_328530 [Colletotrichum zoysiae]|uniref:Uncharacterized protein n=1 Tax=Colletotrichum zoysiae TaxID=1216348 RepID=A0AAD9HK04_9PEZI|nr:hypothetical protein LX32DRAFT_328530 [Colletotrichum zoysiae]